ncbi:MAG TPA: hypothetical protein VNY10_17485 [Roseiarcus sp.]|nr:hypothetical protein [Roseiarcus sp.]
MPPLAYLRRTLQPIRPLPDRRHSRSQEPSPLFERQTELAQIGLGQFADLVRTDTIGGEQTVEFAETEPIERAAEPIWHIGPNWLVQDHFAANPDESTRLQWNPASLLCHFQPELRFVCSANGNSMPGRAYTLSTAWRVQLQGQTWQPFGLLRVPF